MPDPYRIVTCPTPVVGPLRVATATGLVSVDALLRRARADGRRTEWAAAALGGALAEQRAVEQALVRRGTDRVTVGREGFADEVRSFAAGIEDQVRAQLDALGIAMPERPGRTASASSAAAARTAFVRLYEQGLLQLAESVAPECPRCCTVVDRLDCEPVELEDELLTARLPYNDGDGWLELNLAAPELLAGTVAVAVPDGHEGTGRRVVVPVGEVTVPVVVDRRRRRPRPVVPAHWPDDFELARRVGLVPVEVLDSEGVVRAPGPLEGLPRFAARTAARDLLAAAGALGTSRAIGVAERRCLRCGTIVVPRLGMRWSLDLGALEAPVADLVHAGELRFSDPAPRERFLERAGQSGRWCLSHQVWTGQGVPVARCADCDQVAVSVDAGDSCSRCMGPLRGASDVLDARFVGALWPLVSAGWPSDGDGPTAWAPHTTLFVDGPGVTAWVLPMAALGLSLTGSLPFSAVAVHPLHGLSDIDTSPPADLDTLLASGPQAARLALAWATVSGGVPDPDRAARLLACLDAPPEGDADVECVAAAFDECFGAGTPADALAGLEAVLVSGVTSGQAQRLRALVAPITG